MILFLLFALFSSSFQNSNTCGKTEKNARVCMLEILEISQVPTAGRWQMTFAPHGGNPQPGIFCCFPQLCFHTICTKFIILSIIYWSWECYEQSYKFFLSMPNTKHCMNMLQRCNINTYKRSLYI